MSWRNREIHSKVMNGAVDKKSETISEDGAIGAAIRPQKENDVGVLGNASELPDHDVEKCWNGFLSIGHCTIQQPQGQKVPKNQPTSSFPFHIGMSSWPGVLPNPQYMPPPHTAWPINGSPRPSTTMQFPQFKFSQPQSKRCTRHRYIAHSIDAHLQLINKSLSSEPTDPVTSCGLKLNPMLLPTMKFSPGNLSFGDLQGAQSLGSGNDKPPPGQVNNLLHCPGFMFPLGQHFPAMIAPANSSGPLQSGTAVGSASLTAGKPPLPGGATAVSYNHQIYPCNGNTPYMTILKNGCPVPASTSSGMPTFRGGSPAVPFFNPSLYSSPVFNVHNQQQHQVLLPHAPAQSSSPNATTKIGSSSQKQVQWPQQGGDNKFPPLTQPNWVGKTDISRKNGTLVGDGLVSEYPVQWKKYMSGNQVFQVCSTKWFNFEQGSMRRQSE